MKNRSTSIKSSRLLIVLTTLFSLSACQFMPTKQGANEEALETFNPAEKALAEQQVEEIFQQFYQYQLDSSPVLRSTLAMPGQFEWDDISIEAEQQHDEVMHSFRQNLIAIKQSALSADNQLSYELLLQDIEQSLLFTPFNHHHYSLSQMGGWHTRIANILINYQEITTIQEAHDYIQRIKGVRHLFNDLILQLEAAEEAGIIAPQFVYDKVIASAENIITGAPFSNQGDSPIWKDFNQKITNIDLYPSSNHVLVKKAKNAMKKSLLPAYQDLIRFLKKQKLRAPLFQVAKDLPNGDNYYHLLLQHYTTTDLSAEEIHTLGLSEVKRIQKKIRKLIQVLGYPPAQEKDVDINALTLKPFFTWMEDNAERFEENEQGQKDFVAYQRDKVAAISMRLHTSFEVLPSTPIVVRPVAEYRQPSAPIAFYEQPPLDGSRPGFYYVNPARQHDLPKYRLAALAYHEALPGHHMQIALARENDALPSFRRLLGFNAFSEGWALYAEKLADDMGGYTSNDERYGQLIMELWRAVRLVIDTGLHAKGWSQEQALAYRLENTPFSEADSMAAIERYLVMPGQATSYKIGALEIERLRKKAKRILGKQFSLAKFHHTVLSKGALPLDILEQQVDDWIEREDN